MIRGSGVSHLEAKTRKKIIDYLKNEHEVSLKELKKVVPTAPRIVKVMASSGQVRVDRGREPVEAAIGPVLGQEERPGHRVDRHGLVLENAQRGPLHRRGYRQEAVAAPMIETLAAGG